MSELADYTAQAWLGRDGPVPSSVFLALLCTSALKRLTVRLLDLLLRAVDEVVEAVE